MENFELSKLGKNRADRRIESYQAFFDALQRSYGAEKFGARGYPEGSFKADGLCIGRDSIEACGFRIQCLA